MTDAAPTTRQRLLAAARAVFLEEARAADVSLDRVRARAGVSNGSLYHHFPTREALADALYAQLIGEFQQEGLAVLAGEGTAEAGVRALIGRFVAAVRADPGRARLLHEMRRNGTVADGSALRAVNQDGFAQLARWVAVRTAAGQMRPMPFELWMALVFAPVVSLAPRWLADPAAVVPADILQTLADAAWASVAPRSLRKDADP